MAKQQFSQEQIDYAVSSIQIFRGDIERAARWLKVPVKLLKRWQREAETAQSQPLPFIALGRPFPPQELLDVEPDYESFIPAPEVEEWIRKTILSPNGPLYNKDHAHLEDARLGLLWTNAVNMKGGYPVVGTAEIPGGQGSRWQKGRAMFQLRQWFGVLPHFLITLYAPYAARCDDACWCSLNEHELYHCAQKKDAEGDLAFTLEGEPVFTVQGHDVEEFVGVVERYGPDAAAGATRALVRAANAPPTIARANIAVACGTCR